MTAEPRAVAFLGSLVLLIREGPSLVLPTEEALTRGFPLHDLAALRCAAGLPDLSGAPVHAYDLPESWTPPDGWEATPLRQAYFDLEPEAFRIAGTARQKVEWLRTHGFCSRCGATTARHEQHEAMWCPACGHLQFARVAPAVIVLVQRGDEALLARSHHFTPGVYSTLAGFVEPGESLEECVHREIEEEVGVRVGNLRYFGSQPHPFPHSLMVGYVADWTAGEIRVDPEEIEDAAWFRAGSLPGLPHPMSIARALIEDFVTRTR